MWFFHISILSVSFTPHTSTNTKKLQIKSLIVDTHRKQETRLLDSAQESEADEKPPRREKTDGNQSWLQNLSLKRRDEKSIEAERG